MINKTSIFARETHEKLNQKTTIFSFFSVFGVFRGQILIFQTASERISHRHPYFNFVLSFEKSVLVASFPRNPLLPSLDLVPVPAVDTAGGVPRFVSDDCSRIQLFPRTLPDSESPLVSVCPDSLT